MNIGDKLISLQQGVHSSIESGHYDGNGDYHILMRDGGNGSSFLMQFHLVSRGGGNYTLQRLDCGDAPTNLVDRGDGALVGGDYTLNF